MAEKSDAPAPKKTGGKKAKRSLLPQNGFKKVLKSIDKGMGIGKDSAKYLGEKMNEFLVQTSKVLQTLGGVHAGRRTIKEIDFTILQIEDVTINSAPKILKVNDLVAIAKSKAKRVFPLSPIKRAIRAESLLNCGNPIALAIEDLMIWVTQKCLMAVKAAHKDIKQVKEWHLKEIQFPKVGIWGAI